MRKLLLIGAAALALTACQANETSADKTIAASAESPSIVEAAAAAKDADAVASGDVDRDGAHASIP